MTVSVKNIIPAKFAEDAQTTQYTADSVKTVIDKFSVTNIATGNVTFSINLVVSGGTPNAANRILSIRTIAPGETYLCPEVVGHVLEPGGFISTLAGAVSSLTIDASGREIT